MGASAKTPKAPREREESTPPDDHLPAGKSEADRMIRDQSIFPFQGLTVIAKYGRPGRVDRPGAPLHRIADRHHRGGPGNGDGEAEETEEQAGGGAERHQRAGVVSAESHSRELSLLRLCVAFGYGTSCPRPHAGKELDV